MYQASDCLHASVSRAASHISATLPVKPQHGSVDGFEGGLEMPAKTEKQRKFMGAELARKRAGKKTKTGA